MSVKPLFFLSFSCLFALGMASWVYSAGFGLILAFLTYSISGSVTLLLISAISFLPKLNDNSSEFDSYVVAS